MRVIGLEHAVIDTDDELKVVMCDRFGDKRNPVSTHSGGVVPQTESA